MSMTHLSRHVPAAVFPIVLMLGLAACGGGDGAAGDTAEGAGGPSAASEAAEPSPRLAVTYDGGVLVLDGVTLDVVGDVSIDGFTRVNDAGDGRHVLVSAGDAFKVLDTGSWTVPHGDHDHYYVADPVLTDVEFAAEEPGHVVRHAGRTVLFNDGSGLVESFDPAALASGAPETSTYTTDEPHHGVAVELADGSLITTIGTLEARTGVAVLDPERREVARNEDCPGVHGEAVAAPEVVVFGCESGVLVVRDGQITKIPSPDPYGRIGNQAGSEESPIVLGDYKVDPDAELERPERVALIDTASATLRLVDLGTSYTFRSLGRGPSGEALVLGTDRALHVIDPETATVTGSIPVVEPWIEPDEWQSPRPALFVLGHTAYVTEPATNEIHAVDLESAEVTETAVVPQQPNELTGVTG